MTNPIRQAVAVFCGSKYGTNPMYASDAATLAKELALGGFDIVYGGSKKGIMGDLANSALANGASVTGVIPAMLLAWEHEHESLTKLIITKDMHERKRTMYEIGVAGIVLPGGFGTLVGPTHTWSRGSNSFLWTAALGYGHAFSICSGTDREDPGTCTAGISCGSSRRNGCSLPSLAACLFRLGRCSA